MYWTICTMKTVFTTKRFTTVLGDPFLSLGALLDQLCIKRNQHTCLKWTKLFSRGVFGLPGKNKNESRHKTDCCNLLFHRKFVAPSSGAAVGQWTRSRILREKNLVKKLIHCFRGRGRTSEGGVGGTFGNFQYLVCFFLRGVRGVSVHNWKS